MTYCLGVRLNAGLVFAADTRTTAGVDHVSSYRKMQAFVWEGQRLFVLLSAGNLATTQAVVKQLELDCRLQRERSLLTAEHFHDAASYLGEISASIQKRHDGMAQQRDVSFEASFIFGGQIGSDEHELALVYPQGNFISVSPEHPYLQIGETKYGKPILDRFITASVSLGDAARCALVSIDSTIRSNLSVGPPVDLLIYQRDTLAVTHQLRFKANTPYFASLRKHWTEGLRSIFEDLPRFDWERDGG